MKHFCDQRAVFIYTNFPIFVTIASNSAYCFMLNTSVSEFVSYERRENAISNSINLKTMTPPPIIYKFFNCGEIFHICQISNSVV